MNRIHFNVSRLQNTNMKTQLKNALKEIEGVSMVNVDLGRGSVEVGYDDATDVSLIRKRIEDVGCKIE